MIVSIQFVCLSWMDWESWIVLWLERGVSESVMMNEVMVAVELWIVQNSNPFRLVTIHSLIITHLKWVIFLPLIPLSLVWDVSSILHPSHWLVWLIEWVEWTDLPQLQSVKLGGYAFDYCQSVVFESDWMDGLIIQICRNYNPFNLANILLMVMVVMIERRLAINPSTTRTHWQWRVRLIAWMDEWTDLPSLTSFKGDRNNFYAIGSVILESDDLWIDWSRYPSVIIKWNCIRWLLLLRHLFPPILK